MAALPSATVHTVCRNLCQVETPQTQYKAYWRNLNEQRQEGLLCDVVVQSGTRSYHAHKCILAAASPYFKAVFSSPMLHVNACNSKQEVVDFDLYSAQTVQLLLDIIYGVNEEVGDDSADFSDLLKLAEFLQYDWLISILVDSIRSTIDD